MMYNSIDTKFGFGQWPLVIVYQENLCGIDTGNSGI